MGDGYSVEYCRKRLTCDRISIQTYREGQGRFSGFHASIKIILGFRQGVYVHKATKDSIAQGEGLPSQEEQIRRRRMC